MSDALRSFSSSAATELYDAIGRTDAGKVEQLDECARTLWRRNCDGEIGDHDAEVLQSFIDRRRPPTLAQKATRAQSGSVPHVGHGVGGVTPRERPRSPDRQASRNRRRMLGGSSALPPDLRQHYTLGQMAVLCIIAGEIKQTGICDLPVEKIAALAGVCRSTVQTTVHKARENCHIKVTERKRPGRKHLTNHITLISREWQLWVQRAPSAAAGIAVVSTTTIKDADQGNAADPSNSGAIHNGPNLASTTKNILNDCLKGAMDFNSGCDRGEAERWVGELAIVAGLNPKQLPDPWRLKGVHFVREWLEKLDIAEIPRAWLRNVALHVMQRRPEPEPPWSIRYFESELQRFLRLVELDRVKHPPGCLKNPPVFVAEGTLAYEAWRRVRSQESRAEWHLVTMKEVRGKRQPGWYFPSFFPPDMPMPGRAA